jgi:hypothetical protein
MKLELIRVAYTAGGTFGVLKGADGIPFAVTLERPWWANQPSVGDVPGSCIPEGVYRCLRCRRSPDYGYRDSPKFGDTFQVYEVPGRTTILFHKGNLADDTRGCILVGEQFERMQGQAGIAASAAGFAEFLRVTEKVNEFELEIRSA